MPLPFLKEESMNEWQPIETAPKDGTIVLLWSPDWSVPTVAMWNAQYDEPYWQPLEEVISNIEGAIEGAKYWFKYPTPPIT